MLSFDRLGKGEIGLKSVCQTKPSTQREREREREKRDSDVHIGTLREREKASSVRERQDRQRRYTCYTMNQNFFLFCLLLLSVIFDK